MYPTDFEADTSHLSLEEDGAYNRLLRLMWMNPGCTLPDDDAWIMRRMRIDPETYKTVVCVIIDEFFERKNGRVSNARLCLEFASAKDKHKKRVEAGKKGGRNKSLKNKETGSSNALAKPKQPEPQPEPYIKTEPKGSSKRKRGCRLPEDWVASNDLLSFASGEGFSRDEVNREVDKFRDFWHSSTGANATKLRWDLAFKNWIRNARDRKSGSKSGADKIREALRG